MMERYICAGCGSPGAMNKCSRCRSVYFCGKECLHAGWKMHKKECKDLAAAAAAAAGGKGGGEGEGRTQVTEHAPEGKDPDGPAGGDGGKVAMLRSRRRRRRGSDAVRSRPR